jgi:hypothetical protein
VKRLAIAACLAVCASAWSGERAQPVTETAGPELPVLEPGARGTLLTTFEGREPTEVPVKFLGTYRNYAGPGHDVHIIELEGEQAERVGAAHGMSGSPVYFDGRLVGALAYRLGALPKVPIAGVTPIEDMLDASRTGWTTPGGSDATVRPIATPVFLGGLAEPVREWLAPQLEALGFAAVAGGGDATGDLAGATLAPGTPVGVQLVRGDAHMGASGTVTWVDGDVVYAFGHPYYGTGRVEMPMAPAAVIHTLADLAGSHHMVNLGASVGAIVEDRQSALVGRLGREARMIPVHLHVRGGDYGESEFRFEVVASSELTPLLAGATTANSLLRSNGYTEKSTVLARGSLRLENLPELPLEMAFSGSQGIDPGLAVAATLFSILRGLWDNPFDEVVVEGLDVALDVRAEPVSYRVESLHYDRGKLLPGELLTVRCLLREHRGRTVTRELSLQLPEQLPSRGKLTLAVGSPGAIDLALGNLLARRLRTARDLRAVIDALADQRSAHRLTAVVYERGGAVVSRGMAYSELPPTAERLLSLGTRTAQRAARPLVSPVARAEVALDGPVEGGRQIRLMIDRGFGAREDR